VGSTLALAHPLYYDRLVQLASTIFGTISCRQLRQPTMRSSLAPYRVYLTFLGFPHENPYDFLSEFQSICSTIQLTGFTEDALKMRLFVFALKERAKHWFQSLEPNSITSWDQLQQVFLKQYFPIGRTNDIRRAITGITQYQGEPLHETWERLKDLLRSCPHHVVPKWQLV
jgi:hypothetical protein